MRTTAKADRRRRGMPKSRAGRVALGLATAAELTAKICMLVEVFRRPQEELRGPKWAWVMAAFVNTLGPVAWFGWGRHQRPDTQPGKGS